MNNSSEGPSSCRIPVFSCDSQLYKRHYLSICLSVHHT